MKTSLTLTLLTFTFCIISISQGYSQTFRNSLKINVVGGANFSYPRGLNIKKINDKNDKDHTTGSRTGIHLGLNGYYLISNKLSLGLSLLYSQKGYKENINLLYTKESLKTNMNYLDIPLSLMYKTGKFYGLLGPNISILMANKYFYKSNSKQNGNTLNEREGSLDGTKGMLAGYQIGFGIEGKRLGVLARLVRTGKATGKYPFDSFSVKNIFHGDHDYGYATILLGITFNIINPSTE